MRLPICRKRALTWLILLITAGCSIFRLESRISEPTNHLTAEITPTLSITSSGPVYMNMAGIIKSTFLPGSIRISHSGRTIYVDPLMFPDSAPADLICITHNHADHFSMEDIERLSNRSTHIVGPKNISRKLRDYSFTPVRPADRLQIAQTGIEVVPSYNLREGFFSMRMHKPTGQFLGYILALDTSRIYIAGDTDFIPEMHNLENITVAILPIGEGNTAMSPEEAAHAANTIQPLIVLPVHYELGNRSVKKFASLLNRGIQLKTFEPGL